MCYTIALPRNGAPGQRGNGSLVSWSAVEWAKRVRIAGRAKQLLETYASRSNDCDATNVSIERVAREWMCSQSTVKRAKAALLAQGLISVTAQYNADGTRTSDKIVLHVQELPDVMPTRVPREFELHAPTCCSVGKPQVRSRDHRCTLNNNPPTPHGLSAAGSTVTVVEDGDDSSDNGPISPASGKGCATPKRPKTKRGYHEHPRLNDVMSEVEPMLLKFGGYGGNRPKFRREVNVALFSGWDPFALVSRLCASYAGADSVWAVAFGRVRELPPSGSSWLEEPSCSGTGVSMAPEMMSWWRGRAQQLRSAERPVDLCGLPTEGMSAREEWALARARRREVAGGLL